MNDNTQPMPAVREAWPFIVGRTTQWTANRLAGINPAKVMTIRLRDALALVDIRALDHFIVGADGGTSLAEHGLI